MIVYYHSNDNITEVLDNHSDSGVCLLLFTLCLKVFIFVFLMVMGRLFHKEGPMYNKVFCLVLA